MSQELKDFLNDVQRANALSSVYTFLKRQSPGLDIDDMLRAKLIFVVSALDRYVHSIVRRGILEIYIGKRAKTRNFNTFKISLEDYENWTYAAYDSFERQINILSGTSSQFITAGLKNEVNNARVGSYDLLEKEIIRIHSYKSFQSSKNLSEALNLIVDKDVWNEIGHGLGKPPEDVRRTLDLIIDRRNKIVHEADKNPIFPNTLWPINIDDVENATNSVIDIVKIIDTLV